MFYSTSNPLKKRKSIGRLIIKARKQIRMKQIDLARKLKVSRSTIGSFEYGRVEISLKRLIQLSEILNKPLSYFMPEFTVEIKEEEIKNLSEKEKAKEYSLLNDLNFALEMSVRNYLRTLNYKGDDLKDMTEEIMRYLNRIPKFEKKRVKTDMEQLKRKYSGIDINSNN